MATSPHPPRAASGAGACRRARHVLPPSLVVYRPASPPGAKRFPSAAPQRIFASFGCTAIRAIADDVFSPTLAKVSPPSVERYTPSPQPELFRSLPSPVPIQPVFPSEGATATAPIDATDSFSKIPWNLPPLFEVLATPPVA